MLDIQITKTTSPSQARGREQAGLRQDFHRHMFVMDYAPDKAGMTPASSPISPSPWIPPA